MNRPVWNLHAWNNYGDYVKVLETYCDYLERKKDYCKDCSHCSLWWKDDYIHQLEERLRSLDIDINPCKGCADYCYKNDCCKSNGGCGNKELDERIKRLEEENKCYGEVYSECEMYKKAFNRACFELGYSNKQLRDLDKGFVKMTEEDWKEYILKNV